MKTMDYQMIAAKWYNHKATIIVTLPNNRIITFIPSLGTLCCNCRRIGQIELTSLWKAKQLWLQTENETIAISMEIHSIYVKYIFPIF